MNHFGDRLFIHDVGVRPGWFARRLALLPGILRNPAFPWNPPRGARDSVSEESSKNLHSRFDSGRKIYGQRDHGKSLTHNCANELDEVVLERVPAGLGVLRLPHRLLLRSVSSRQPFDIRDTCSEPAQRGFTHSFWETLESRPAAKYGDPQRSTRS